MAVCAARREKKSENRTFFFCSPVRYCRGTIGLGYGSAVEYRCKVFQVLRQIEHEDIMFWNIAVPDSPLHRAVVARNIWGGITAPWRAM